LTAALWPRRELTIRLDSSARSEASGTTSFIATTGLGSLYREQMSAASL